MSQPNILLVDNDMFERVKEKKIKKSTSQCVAIPCLMFKYEFTSREAYSDFLVDAICGMYKAYKKEFPSISKQDIITQIASDLKLKESLVELVSNSEKGYIDSENEDARPQRTDYIYFFYDLVGKKYLNFFLFDDKLSKFKHENNNEKLFRPSMGISKEYYINKLSYEYENINPKQDDIYDILKSKFGKKAENAKLLYTSIADEVYIVSSLYYDHHDLSGYCAENPFDDGRASWIVDDVAIALKEPSRNKGLIKSIEKMKESIKSKNINGVAVPKSEKNTLWQVCETKINKRYGKEQLAKFPLIKESYINYFVKMTKLIQVGYDETLSTNEDIMQSAKKDYYIALYKMIEDILGYCFIKNHKNSFVKQYVSYISNMDDSQYCIYEYKKAMQDCGFNDEGVDDGERINKAEMRYTFEHQKSADKTITTLLYCNLIEALYDSKHPFNALIYKYPDLFSIVYEARDLRNPSKHGSKNQIKWGYFDFQGFIIELFDTIVMNPINKNVKIQIDTNEYSSDIKGEFEKLDNEINTMLSNYIDIESNEDIAYYSRALVRAFISKDGEYLSEAYNLMNELLGQLIYVASGRDGEIDSKMLAECLGEDFDNNKVASSVEKIINNSGFPCNLTNRYNINGLKNGRIYEHLSLGNKLYYLIMLLYSSHPEFLNELLDKDYKLIELVEQTCDSDEGRGHNNLVDFEKKDFNDFNTTLLKVTNNICKYIRNNLVREAKNNG